MSDIKSAAQPTLRTKVGTRVAISANPVSRMLYSGGLPPNGTQGTVTTVAGPRGRMSSMKGPGGGLLYVEWDDGNFMGVSPRDMVLVGKRRNMSIEPRGNSSRTKHLKGSQKGFVLCGEQAYPGTTVTSAKDTTCFYCKQAWEREREVEMQDRAERASLHRVAPLDDRENPRSNGRRVNAPKGVLRYSGDLTFRVLLNPDDTFTVRISAPGEKAYVVSGVRLPAAWRQSYDSPEAYDSIAAAALSFAQAGLYDPHGSDEAYANPDPFESSYYETDDRGETRIWRPSSRQTKAAVRKKERGLGISPKRRNPSDARSKALDLLWESQTHNSIAHAKWSQALEDALLGCGEDHVHNGDVVEFWGTNDDGDWRVHLERSGARRNPASSAAREAFIKAVGGRNVAAAFEDQVLSAGREFLPAYVIAVLEGAEPTMAYWRFLKAQWDGMESEAGAWSDARSNDRILKCACGKPLLATRPACNVCGVSLALVRKQTVRPAWR